MKTLIHQSPLGALEIVGVPGVIEPGEPFKVDDDVAESLLIQSELYRVATKAQLKAIADQKAADDTADAEAAAAAEAAAQNSEGDPA